MKIIIDMPGNQETARKLGKAIERVYPEAKMEIKNENQIQTLEDLYSKIESCILQPEELHTIDGLRNLLAQTYDYIVYYHGDEYQLREMWEPNELNQLLIQETISCGDKSQQQQ